MSHDHDGNRAQRILLTQSEFGAWWDVLNREYPVYKGTIEDLAAQAGTWYAQLKFSTKPALDEALERWLRTQPHRPKLVHILTGAGEHMRRITEAMAHRHKQDMPAPDANHCICGCGGQRWSEVLLDAKGKPRHYPANLEAFGLPASLSANMREGVAAQITALAGDVMRRQHVECRRLRTDAPPHETHERIGTEEGLPVWMRSPETLEAAA